MLSRNAMLKEYEKILHRFATPVSSWDELDGYFAPAQVGYSFNQTYKLNTVYIGQSFAKNNVVFNIFIHPIPENDKVNIIAVLKSRNKPAVKTAMEKNKEDCFGMSTNAAGDQLCLTYMYSFDNLLSDRPSEREYRYAAAQIRSMYSMFVPTIRALEKLF